MNACQIQIFVIEMQIAIMNWVVTLVGVAVNIMETDSLAIHVPHLKPLNQLTHLKHMKQAKKHGLAQPIQLQVSRLWLPKLGYVTNVPNMLIVLVAFVYAEMVGMVMESNVSTIVVILKFGISIDVNQSIQVQMKKKVSVPQLLLDNFSLFIHVHFFR